jgi:hypothetical protein
LQVFYKEKKMWIWTSVRTHKKKVIFWGVVAAILAWILIPRFLPILNWNSSVAATGKKKFQEDFTKLQTEDTKNALALAEHYQEELKACKEKIKKMEKDHDADLQDKIDKEVAKAVVQKEALLAAEKKNLKKTEAILAETKANLNAGHLALHEDREALKKEQAAFQPGRDAFAKEKKEFDDVKQKLMQEVALGKELAQKLHEFDEFVNEARLRLSETVNSKKAAVNQKLSPLHRAKYEELKGLMKQLGVK